MTTVSNSANGAMLSPQATMIETSTGGFVDIANPQADTIRLADIARGLALTCRYGGQISQFYSVAEHSLLVHDLLKWQGARPVARLAALFHDAAEAYLGDVVAPLKFGLRRGDVQSVYDEFSDRMDAAIAMRFGLSPVTCNLPAVKAADMWALKIEAAKLTATGGAHWRWPGELPNDGQLPDGVWWAGGLPTGVAEHAWLQVVARYGFHVDEAPVAA